MNALEKEVRIVVAKIIRDYESQGYEIPANLEEDSVRMMMKDPEVFETIREIHKQQMS